MTPSNCLVGLVQFFTYRISCIDVMRIGNLLIKFKS